MNLAYLVYFFYSTQLLTLPGALIAEKISLTPLGAGKWKLSIPTGMGIDVEAVLRLFPSGGEWEHNLLLTTNWGPSQFVNRGFLNEKAGDYKRAMRDYSKALARNPSYTQAWYFRGTLASKLGLYKVADDHLGRALALYYHWKEGGYGMKPIVAGKTHYQRAIARLALGNAKGAVQDLLVAARSDFPHLAKEAFSLLCLLKSL